MIEARGILVRRRGRHILDIDALAIGGGGLTCLVGPNGAGKSTLVRVLSGELVPDRGIVRLDGQEVGAIGAAALARRRAVLPQATELGFPLTVEELVGLGRIPHAGHATWRDDAIAIAGAMAEAGVAHLAGREVHTLSGGEAQRAHLARVLAQLTGTPSERAVLILDEPTSSLDLLHAHAILRVAAARARAGATVIAVLHDLSLAVRWGDRAIVLDAGTVIADGVPATVLEEELVGRVWGLPVRRLSGRDSTEMAFVPR